MNKTNVKANPSTTHRHDTPNNKTHKLKDAKQNVALFFREEKQTQHHEREGVCV